MVTSAVETFYKAEGLAGFGMDFAIMTRDKGFRTCLVEVNDGYSLGRYEGLNGKDYTDLLIARWQ